MTKEDIFDRLFKLQDVLIEKIELETDIEETPKTLNSQEELLHRLKSEYIAKDQEYVALKKDENECKNALLIAESEREKAEKKMDATSTQREIEALDKEIAAAAKKEDDLRKKLQGISQRAIAMDEAMKADKALMDQQDAELHERKKGIEKEIKQKQTKLDKIKEREAELTEGLDHELVFKFERIIRKKGGRGIVAVRGTDHPVCQSCRMILPVQFAASVRTSGEMLACPYCSSILYYEDSDGEEEEEVFDDEDSGALRDFEDSLDDEFGEEDEVEDEKIRFDDEE